MRRLFAIFFLFTAMVTATMGLFSSNLTGRRANHVSLLPVQVNTPTSETFIDTISPGSVEVVSGEMLPDAEQAPVYAFSNPAGCSPVNPGYLSKDEILENAQKDIGDSIDLSTRKMNYIWNGPLNTMLDVTDDPYVFEFSVNLFEPPYTYKGDAVATALLEHGFVVWFRSYGDSFRLLAIPMLPGVYESPWGEYVKAYWEKNGVPLDDHIQPVTKKLPCHWIIDQGWVTNDTLLEMFNFDWSMPDYLTTGRKYLASTCTEAYRISIEEIGYWDATSMCGPLAWTIIKDTNSFPYRMGNWYSSARLFLEANPRVNGRPWLGLTRRLMT